MTRAIVVGAGSIGTRHAAVLSELGHEVAFVSSRTDLQRRAYPDLPTALAEFDPGYVVVANETELHERTVNQLIALGYDGDLLVEKPLAIPVELVRSGRFRHVGVGFNLRFHPLVDALTTALADQTILTVEVYAGQHLSGWRPDRPVASQYSSSRGRGGGVLRDLSHELDYLALLLGSCTGVFARGGRLAKITVDSDDAWGIVAAYERAPLVTIQLNYLDTRARRRLVLNTGMTTIEADFIASTMRINDELRTFPTDKDASYRGMHCAMLDDNGLGVTTMREAAATDQLIAMIELSAERHQWVEQS